MRLAEGCRRGWITLTGLALLLVGVALVSPAWAAEPLGFQITVLNASPEPGGIDPAAQRFNRLLGAKVRYESLTVVSSTRQETAFDQIGSVSLPDGSSFRYRPIDQSDRGVLVAVDWQKTAQGDFHLPAGKPLIFGGAAHAGGQLVVILEMP
jgi:hypothetical protein